MTDDLSMNSGAGENQVVAGEETRDQLVGQAVSSVTVPAPTSEGQVIELRLESGQQAVLDFDAAAATPQVEGNNFVLAFDSNGDGTADSRVVFLDLVAQAQGESAPTLVIGGVEIAADQLVGQALALADGDTLETAAGPQGGQGAQGGGGSRYSDDTGEAIELLDAQDTIEGTGLEFGTLATGEDETDPAEGTIDVTFLTVQTVVGEGGEGELVDTSENYVSGSFAGGFEDWQPNQHLGDETAAPMQVIFTFTPADNETLDSIDITDLPDGVTLYVGGTDEANIVFSNVPGEEVGSLPLNIDFTDLDSVYLLGTEHSDADLTVVGQANITDPDSGLSASLPFTSTAVVDAAADKPEFEFGGEGDSLVEQATVTVPVEVTFGDYLDGSESHTIVLSNIPSDWVPTFELPYTVSGLGEGEEPGQIGLNTTYSITIEVTTDMYGEAGLVDLDLAFDPQDWTSSRWSDGSTNEGGDAQIGIKATAEETNVSDEELTGANDNAESETSFTVSIAEDVPEVEGVNFAHDETDGVDSDANDVASLSSAIATALYASFTGLVAATGAMGAAIGQAEGSVGFDFVTDGPTTPTDASDVGTEVLEFKVYNGDPSGLYTGGVEGDDTGVEVNLYTDSSNANIVWGLDDEGNAVFAVYLEQPTESSGSATMTFVQYQAINHFEPGDGSEGTHDEGEVLNLEYHAVDGEGDASDYATANITIEDDGPSISVYGFEATSLGTVIDQESNGITAGGNPQEIDRADLSYNVESGNGEILIKGNYAKGNTDGSNRYQDGYELELQAGETLTVSGDDGNTDGLIIQIYTWDGDNFVLEQTSPADGDVSYTALSDGPHYIKVYNPVRSGNYEVKVSVTPAIVDDLQVDETDLLTDATANFAGLFTVDGGMDGVDSIDYALSVANAGSGLVDTATGEDVVLSNNGGVIEGRTAGSDELVFTLSVDGDGNVTLDQKRAVKHEDDNEHDSEVSLAAGSVSLSATVTDGDGDTASDSLDLSGAISFKDDGPTVSANAKVVADEDDLPGGIEGGEGDEDSANLTGTLGHDYGADGAGTVLLTGATLPDGFTASVNEDGTVLTISQGEIEVLQVSLADTISGDYTVKQLAAIDHPEGDGENNVDFTLSYEVTDGDGDTATGSFTITVDDDTPVFEGAANENLIVNGSFETTPDFNGWTTFDSIEGWTSPSGLIEVQENGVVGDAQDGNNKVELDAYGNSEIAQTVSGLNEGETYELSFYYKPRIDNGSDTDDMLVKWNGEEVLALTSTDADGWTKFTVKLVAAAGDNVLSFAGDGSSNGLGALLDNVSLVAIDVDEAAVDFGGEGGEGAYFPSVTGDLGIAFGADGPDADVSFDTAAYEALGLTSGLDDTPLSYNVSGNTLTASADGEEIFTLSIDPVSGDYTFTLKGPLDHADGDGSNTLSLALPFTASDADGDPVDGYVAVVVQDDVPMAGDVDAGMIEEEDLLDDDAENPTLEGRLDIDFGTDGGQVSGIAFAGWTDDEDGDPSGDTLTSGGEEVVFADAYVDGGNLVYIGSVGDTEIIRVEIDQDSGDYSVTLSGPVDQPDLGSHNTNPWDPIALTFRYLTIDGDGDEDISRLEVVIEDNQPSGSDVDVLSFDEADLPEGTEADGAALTKEGNFLSDADSEIVDMGADGFAGVVSIQIGEDEAVELVEGDNDFDIDFAGGTIHLVVDKMSGAYSVTLTEAFDHSDEGDDASLSLPTITAVLADGDGDTVESTLDLTVDDDAPEAAEDEASTMASGNSGEVEGNVLDNDDLGADGGRVSQVSFNGVDYVVPTDGEVTVAGDYGTLLISSDGSYSYTPIVSLDGGSDVFDYEVTDGDGDTAGSTLSVDVAGLSTDVEYVATGWNDPKTITLEEGDGNSVSVRDYVEVHAASFAQDEGVTLVVENAKRGDIELGDEDDALILTTTTNGASTGIYDNEFTIDAGDGDDELVIGEGEVRDRPEDTEATITDGRYTSIDVDLGGGNDSFTNTTLSEDTVDGGTGDDEISAGGGDDLLIGGAGSDLLIGGDGADTFDFTGQSVGSDMDTVQDYSYGEGDILDISELVTFDDGGSDVVADFIQATNDGTQTTLSVSTDDGVSYTEIAVLDGISGGDTLKVVLDDAEYEITVGSV